MLNSDIFSLCPKNRYNITTPAKATITAYNLFNVLSVVATPIEAT
jgi:hypothetical protein